MSDSEVNVKIGADASGFVEGTHEAEEGMGSLGDALREFGAEQRSEGRFAGFLASQVEHLGIASKGAASDIASLVSAFSYGGGIAVAIEAVKIGIEKFNELRNEEDKGVESAKRWATDAAASVDKFIDSLKAAADAEGKVGTALKLSTDTAGLRKQIEESEKELASVRNNLAAAQNERATAVARQSPTSLGEDPEVTAATEKVTAALEEQTKVIDQLYAARYQLKRATLAADPAIEAEKSKAEVDAIDKKNRAAYAAQLQLIQYDEQETAEAKRQLDQRVAAWVDAQKKMADADFNRIHAGLEAEALASQEAIRLENERLEAAVRVDKEMQKLAEKQAERNKQEADDLKRNFIQPMESSFDQAIKSMILDQQSFNQTMNKLWKELANDFLNGFLKELENVFLGTGGGGGGLFGFLGNLFNAPVAGGGGGAAGGADIGTLIDTAGVLPLALTASPAVNFSGGGSSGGGAGVGNPAGLTINVNALDGQSVKDFVSSTTFANAYAEAVRNGRLPG